MRIARIRLQHTRNEKTPEKRGSFSLYGLLGAAPSRVIAEIEVDVPRPRDQIETRALRRFVELRAEVARLIRDAGSGGDGSVA